MTTQVQVIRPVSTSLMPTDDGGAVLTLDGTTDVVLSANQASWVLRGLLKMATIKIEPKEKP